MEQQESPYKVQSENVTWEVGRDGKLRIEVDLYGEGVETKGGNLMIARSPGWQEVGQRLWYGYAFNLSVIQRRPGWEERSAERERQRQLTAPQKRAVRMMRRAEGYAKARGIPVEQWLEEKAQKALVRSWPLAAADYQELYGVPLPGYVAHTPRVGKKRSTGPGSALAKGKATYAARRASGYWYDEKGRKLSPEERKAKKAELEAQSNDGSVMTE